MVRNIKIIFLFAFLFTGKLCWPQDPEFSQFYANPLYLNPALAGIAVGPRIILNYRNQWPGLGQAFVTYNGSFDTYIDVLHGGVGLVVTADRSGGGSLTTTMINAVYSYKLNITSRLQANGAIKGGYYRRDLARDKLIFGDSTKIDPVINPDDPYSRSSIGAPDFGAGVFFSYDNLLYGGFSVDHLFQPDIGFSSISPSPLYMKFTIHAGSVINLRSGGADPDREFSLSPNVLYQQQFKYHQLNLGLYLTFDPMVAGMWFRYNFENADAIIPMIGFHWKNLRIAYSYDYSLSKLKDVSGGAHEVSVSWQFATVEKRREIKAIKCPRF